LPDPNELGRKVRNIFGGTLLNPKFAASPLPESKLSNKPLKPHLKWPDRIRSRGSSKSPKEGRKTEDLEKLPKLHKSHKPKRLKTISRVNKKLTFVSGATDS